MRDAIEALRGENERGANLQLEVQTAIAEADRGKVRPLDTNATLLEGASRLRISRAVRIRSRQTLFGRSLYEIAIGSDELNREPRCHAHGFVAIGDIATCVLAIGGIAKGIVAFGGLASGVFAMGGLAAGILAVGGLACGLRVASGGLAIGSLAWGGVALGGIAYGRVAVRVVAIGVLALGYYASDKLTFGIEQIWQPPMK